jgi:ribosome-binding protein aMBF1 (putative translation factor)
MEPKKFSYLRQVRKAQGISSKVLARKLKVHPTNICHIEYGRKTCGEAMARRFGEFFKEDWNKFLSRKNDEQLD